MFIVSSQDSGFNLLLQHSLGKYNCFSRCFCTKGKSIWKKDEPSELWSPWTSHRGSARLPLPRVPPKLFHSLPQLPQFLQGVATEGVTKSPGLLGFDMWQFPSAGFSSYSPAFSWGFKLAKQTVQISEIIHCGFHLNKLVSAPKKGLHRTGSFSWI